ncbi:16S rRNA (cytosine(1402)-N(4))-methyltransferase RsmH [candidate division TA06 bacterium]|uniref:Ribosomal RNA small subunit methyltransferase H n=1 Tax=candidate division TA06 bacterium TaxID=2250710 RepID=A0A933IAV2_UNCT6|nr:16S rRNA (cytosine(1402)-N(4))-methyltransferase RsmH [candidate division TA06 bacterium]
MEEFRHQPVLLEEAIDLLNVRPGGNYIDATLGGGGHALEILKKNGPSGILIGLDRDPQAIEAAAIRLAGYRERFTAVNIRFGRMAEISRDLKLEINGALFDLGLSSPQIDHSQRGFSFMGGGPLDMRMGLNGISARDLVNNSGEKELADIFYRYGEEQKSRKIARAVVEARSKNPIETTGQLAQIIKNTRPQMPAKTLARVFQAIRIKVNDELGELERGLQEAVAMLSSGGRIVVISYHSLEDRLVKETFRRLADPCTCPPRLPACVCGQKSAVKIITKKAMVPSSRQISENGRAHSAKLRAAEKA